MLTFALLRTFEQNLQFRKGIVWERNQARKIQNKISPEVLLRLVSEPIWCDFCADFNGLHIGHIEAQYSAFLLINEEISDKLWESALADPFQFTIYSRQKASLSRYGAREDASYYKAMYIC